MGTDAPNDDSSGLSAIATAAKGLSRNPLGIIALFIVLIYGLASLVVGFGSGLTAIEKGPLIWFLVLFPVAVLLAFCWLVSRHHTKLYAPKDFSSDESFLQGAAERANFRRQVMAIENKIEGTIQNVLTAPELLDALEASDGAIEITLANAAKKVAKELRSASSIVIDARQFTHSNAAWYPFPLAAFPSFGELTDEAYFMLQDHIAPFEYGISWSLKNRRTGKEIRGIRSIIGKPAGVPIEDNRSLAELDIRPSDTLEVVRPTISEPVTARDH